MKYVYILVIITVAFVACTPTNTFLYGTDENGDAYGGDTQDDTTHPDSNTQAPFTMTDTVIFETTKGSFTVELDRQAAPTTVANFLTYVEDGHYDGTIFHRVMPNFMAQGGGFTPDGAQKPTMVPIQLESQNGLTNDRGTIAMARTSVPDSATSQFFVNVVDNDFLNYAPGNPGYAVFGRVTQGMDVIDEIVAAPSTTKGGHQNWPVEDIIIERAYIAE